MGITSKQNSKYSRCRKEIRASQNICDGVFGGSSQQVETKNDHQYCMRSFEVSSNASIKSSCVSEFR